VIARIMAWRAELAAARQAPLSPLTAAAGALCLILGASVVQRYVDQQRQALGAAWMEMQRNRVEQMAMANGTGDPGPILVYSPGERPTAEDLDPLGRGDQADDELAGATEEQR